MELETLLTGSKWKIIEALAEQPSSPMTLAKRLDTTMANISQQIRLLETAGIVKKQKVGSNKPGKPRTTFSLADDYGMIIVFSKGFAKKKLIRLSTNHKEVLKKWLED